MYYTREKHKRFLDKELTAISEDYLKKCYVFQNVDDEVYAYMQEQFLKVKAQ